MSSQDQIVVYPIIIENIPDETNYPYLVTIPDLDNGMTEGKSIEDSIAMAEDFIGTASLTEDMPKSNYQLPKVKGKAIATLVRVNVSEYRRNHNGQFITQTVAIPDFLDGYVEEDGMTLSGFLIEAIKEKYNV